MTAPTVTKAAQDYLAAVERELLDLPADERAELLEDLAMHLSELEDEGDDRSLESRLGSSADYASELRAAAGLPSRTATPRVRPQRVRAVASKVWGSSVVRETRTFLPTLAPAWWVLRGYLVVLLPSLRHITGTHDFPVPAPYDNRVLGAALVVLAVLASIAFGRRTLPRPAAVLVVGLNLALAAIALNVASTAPSRLAVHSVRVYRGTDPSFNISPLVSKHGPVTNIYPYGPDGKPLKGVLLYDQDGRPLYSGKQQWFPDHCARISVPPLAKDGVPIRQSFPQTYALDGSGLGISGLPLEAGQCKPLAIPKVTLPVLK